MIEGRPPDSHRQPKYRREYKAFLANLAATGDGKAAAKELRPAKQKKR